ncbi:MAG: hypothetical protein KBF97_02650, partial [Bacteroidetes bacterium]|nr:hypothetical protein [Bacteroidota bacterium]
MNSPIIHSLRLFLPLLLAAAVLFSCTDSVQIEEVEDTFALYLLQDTTLTANDAVAKPLSSLRL